MRNFFKLIILFVAFVGFFSSCKDKNTNITNATSITFKSADCNFYGDPDWYNLYYYDLYLYDANLTTNKNGSGTMVYLALNCKKTDANMILAGTYNVNDVTTPQEFTFERGSWSINKTTQEKKVVGSYIGIVKNGQVTDYYLIVSGSAIVNQNGTYTITAMVNTDTNKEFELKYTGAISITDMVVPMPKTLTKGEIWYWGDIYKNNLNVFTIRLGADNVNLSTFAGSGDAMQIEVYTPTTAKTEIPTGTYPIKKINDNIVNSSLAGEYNSTDNADYGTVYYTSDKLLINQGIITITNKGNNDYTLEFNFTDDYYGYTASDKFDINLPFVNRASGAPKMLRVQSTQKTPMQRAQAAKSNKNRFDRYEKSNSKNILEMTKR